ncbi:sugar phosphate nucleotidyltransferase [Streptosporangium sp. NBC_01755]|uniref:sugar phosphate nucleotidyltransferase n=1 Tax=unclassified Streptosporangium TaxID=2632669 RepID=UPI002DD8F6F4|nr:MULTISPECIES: sugar phosphate nucleotidyltransferase [unclassified Streptosporangium]WSA24560.1 sugar phosphate nucleotidyltransferase [Streptosporangium sp. NBC_01810]WSC97366.1 sugar phosphate nucleotidyltransferase [Streptosporangium sp. NBC_01755]
MTRLPQRPSCPAVVTAAGYGTRFQPFSTWVPKEMLPIGSEPALGHVITECLAAGADLVHVVTRPGDQIIPAYISGLREEGLPVRATPEDLSHGYGNAAPLLTLAQQLTDCDLFMVAFGDDVLLGGVPGADLAAMREQAGRGADFVIAAQLIDRADIGSFGIVDLAEPGGDRVSGIRQRPAPATVDEPLAVVSRLVLRPFVLHQLIARPQARGEVDLGLAVGEHAHTGDVRVRRLSADWVTVGEPRRYADALTRHWRDHAPPPTPLRATP